MTYELIDTLDSKTISLTTYVYDTSYNFTVTCRSYSLNHQISRVFIWLSRDPIGIKGGLNEYEFVNNDAVNKWDKLGLSAMPEGYGLEKTVNAMGDIVVTVVEVNDKIRLHRAAGELILKEHFKELNCSFFRNGGGRGLWKLPRGSVERFSSLTYPGASTDSISAAVFSANSLNSAMIVYDTLTFLKSEPYRFEELKTALMAYINGGRQRTMCYSVCDKIVSYAKAIPTGPLDGIIQYVTVNACVNACEKGCCPDQN
ncbi:MAG: hypothetical protein PF692_00570 [Kiritimatiellae bacterium]|jgi:RHS repeat-associated protein|nr:hypothetical protein [Kiritimatiellia bacterium]